ncbi:MAG: YebC/PmpR family DNA-binding transcriptional regulator [Planctomycetaceae bacterium]|jgi:YebC/PmpR family DNA-binding regulatory protein|nr:YebC/PmpR family DNA-binding transcriptional regulator [Planctomycetaceae bacterium]MDP7277010.1 YebC/PmpR family DNA-binding transcriptional regulator [Planctomycetaceae bacterium]
MAGHSHWAGIKHKKGVADKKRGKLFGKLSRAIIVAAQQGGGDPDMNLTLRYAIDRARKASMPKDNIDRAVQKGCGEAGGVEFTEILYEGYGVGGVAVMCEALTDNRNRTAGEVRKIFEVGGGNLGSSGCVAWLFQRKGLFTVARDAVDEDALMELALEAGADDIEDQGEVFQVTSPPEAFQSVAEVLREANVETQVSEIARVPMSTVDLDASNGRRVLNLLEALEDQDDMQSVTANFNVPDEILAEVTG